MTIKNESSERGAIIPIMAILAVVVVAFLGMPVDTGMLATTSNQYKHAADYAVLGALETYIQQSPANHNLRLNAATERAKEILNADRNLNSALGATFFENVQTSFDIGPNVEEENGKIIPGRWNRITRQFTPVAATAEANALKLELAPRKLSPLRTMFMRVLGIYSNTFRVSAIAYASPVHLVTVVDLSHAVTYDSYWKTDVGTAALPAPVGPVAKSEWALEVTSTASPFSNYLSSDMDLGASAQSIYNGLEPVRSAPPPDSRAGIQASIPVSRHYRDDYTQASLASVSFNHGVERYVFNTEVIPEPLASMTAAVRYAQDLMLNRRVEGDLMAIVGSDDEIHPVRVMGDLTSSPTTMVAPVAGEAEFETFRNALAPYDPLNGDTVASYAQRVASVGFFPRTRNFNLPKSLRAAQRLLEDSRDEQAKEIVILFTAGISNCRNEFGPSNCQTKNPTFIQESLDDARAIAMHPDWTDPGGSGRPISLNILMTGTAEGGSTLVKKFTAKDRADNVRHCMPDWLARQVNTSFVNSSFDAGIDSYFFTSNQLYDLAKMTNGLYFPMRTCCSLNACSCATEADLKAAVNFQARCLSAGADLSLVTSLGNAELDKFMEAGRLLCDPFGRRKEQQAIEAMKEIIGQPTIMLVREGI